RPRVLLPTDAGPHPLAPSPCGSSPPRPPSPPGRGGVGEGRVAGRDTVGRRGAWGGRRHGGGGRAGQGQRAQGPARSEGGPAPGGEVARASAETAGPFTQANALVGGFMIVSAERYAQALEVAREMPGWTQGSSIEIREIAAT